MDTYYKKKIAILLSDHLSLSDDEIINLIGSPPKKDMGDYAFPCFTLAKELKKSPQAIAQELVSKLPTESAFQSMEAMGPYINFYLNKSQFISDVLKRVLTWTEEDFKSIAKGKTVVIDFSSPNIAKPFSIAHLRSTAIGNSLAHIFDYIGYRVVRINHLGDWGTSFGKLIVAYKRWGDEKALSQSPIQYLLDLYVRFHKEVEEHSELEEEAKTWFKRLEDGNNEALILWNRFKDESLKEFNRMYDIIGVSFDHYWGESFYQDKINPVLEEIEGKKLLTESQGATIVDLEAYDMPPLLLRKQDGATLYATRDLAAALYRHDQFHFDEMIYVVGGEQSLHFKQVFKVLEMMGHKWVDHCEHVGFGLIQFKDGKMSTRKGKIIFLEDVITKAKELALEKIKETEAEKSDDEVSSDMDMDERALKIGVSSVIFSDLKNGRMKDVLFDWEEILNPRGETGIYLQYTHARLCGVIRKFETRIGPIEYTEKGEMASVTEEASFDIAKELSGFRDQVIYAAKTREPSVIARYLLNLAQAFSSYYRVYHVINEKDGTLSQERILSVLAVKKVLADGLKLLGIEPMDRM